jgi:FXSXX-COOH protein
MARIVVRVRSCHDIASSRPVFTGAETSIDIILKAEIDRIRRLDHFSGRAMNEEAVLEYGGGLIDVTGLSLSALEGIESSRLELAVRRLVDEANVTPVAKFQSAV